jgi:hypothetical protein
MKGFRSGSGSRRSPGGRSMKGPRAASAARPAVAVRPPDAALGRATRGLVGPTRGSPAARGGRTLPGIRLRAGRIVTPARAAGLLGMLATGFLFTLVTGPTAFGLSRTDIPDLTWTDAATIRETLALEAAGNVVRLDTVPLEAALETLPGVAAAEVSVTLPDAAVVVGIEERRPVLAWQVREQRFIADGEGAIFAIIDASERLPDGVAVVDDRRQGAITFLGIGRRLDPVDLDVATRLGSLTTADIGSSADTLRVVANDADGFVVIAPGGWTAVFGFYSPATRPTDIIPGQVRLLRSLLDGREATLRRIILASATDGTYVPRHTPRPTSR